MAEDRWRIVADGVSDDARDAVEASVPERVAVTLDDGRLCVYAGTEADALLAREAVATHHDGPVRADEWRGEAYGWRQCDPALTGRAATLPARPDTTLKTRTFGVRVGALVRRDIERTMRETADGFGLTCEVRARRRFITTRLDFTVSGAAHRVDEFGEIVKGMNSNGVLGYT